MPSDDHHAAASHAATVQSTQHNGADILAFDDAMFGEAWDTMSPEERHEAGPAAFARIHALRPWVTAGTARLVREQAKREAAATPSDNWPAALDLVALAAHEPEPPAFIIPDWLPCGYATLIAGHGGIGKSAIALNLAVCIAAGLPFIGLPVQQRRVLVLSCEDRERVLHWRLDRICAHLGVDLASLRDHLEIIDLVGHDAVLWERDPHTGYTNTSAYAALESRVKANQTEVLVIDGIADVFAGNENARSDVKRFVNSLVSLVPSDTGAVLLIGHVAKAGSTNGAAGDGYSGSTGWHNSVRARWYLYPEATQGDEGDTRTGDLILDLQKSNLGRTDQSMRFTWDGDAHLFIGREVMGASHFDRVHRDREEQSSILKAMQGCVAADISIPAAMTGPRTAYLVLNQRPEFPASLKGGGRQKSARFRRQIEALRQMRHIEEGSYQRKNRHFVATLAMTTEGLRQCAA